MIALALIILTVIGTFTDDTAGSDKSAAGVGAGKTRPSAAAGATRATSSETPATELSSGPADVSQRSNRTAAGVLATLTVKGRAPKTGYSRDQFGPAWTDDNNDPLGHNGCDTRNDILRRDLHPRSVVNCAVVRGTLRDPYTASTIHFLRGVQTSQAVQIDHVVALSDAWQTGAQYWAASTRTDFANDPLNLLAVDGATNEAKGDGDAATWLPPNKAYRCSYVARQVAVKDRYHLWVTQAEQDAIARVLHACPGQTAPSESGTASIAHAPVATRSSQPPISVYYANCAAARAAGAAPLRRGDPGYRPELDRDGDGKACEP